MPGEGGRQLYEDRMLHAGAKAAFKRKRAANPGMKRGQMTNGFDDDDEGGGKLARPLPLGLDWAVVVWGM